jgi:hypothetical protein
MHGVIQFLPLSMPTQLAQRVISYPHPVLFSQPKASAGQPNATECERYRVAQQLALGEGHFLWENG